MLTYSAQLFPAILEVVIELVAPRGGLGLGRAGVLLLRPAGIASPCEGDRAPGQETRHGQYRGRPCGHNAPFRWNSWNRRPDPILRESVGAWHQCCELRRKAGFPLLGLPALT